MQCCWWYPSGIWYYLKILSIFSQAGDKIAKTFPLLWLVLFNILDLHVLKFWRNPFPYGRTDISVFLVEWNEESEYRLILDLLHYWLHSDEVTCNRIHVSFFMKMLQARSKFSFMRKKHSQWYTCVMAGSGFRSSAGQNVLAENVINYFSLKLG